MFIISTILRKEWNTEPPIGEKTVKREYWRCKKKSFQALFHVGGKNKSNVNRERDSEKSIAIHKKGENILAAHRED